MFECFYAMEFVSLYMLLGISMLYKDYYYGIKLQNSV